MRYFNNAATSYPKPPQVVEAVSDALLSAPWNPHRDSGAGKDPALECRRRLCALFGASRPERVVFTSGATLSVNMLLNGLVPDWGHIVTSQAEHNAVLRPVYQLVRSRAARVTLLPCGPLGQLAPEELARAVDQGASVVVLSAINNVTGWVQDLAAVYDICSRRRVPLILDCAQFAGTLPTPAAEMPLAAWVFAGHKGLGGPTGIGGFVLGDAVELEPWLVGGTGILSELEGMPQTLPLRFEPGVPNDVGIRGLSAACACLLEAGPATVTQGLNDLVSLFKQRCDRIPGVEWHAAEFNPAGIVSLRLSNWPVSDLGYVLEHSFGCRVRCGLHCAPLLHRAMGTYPDGTLRISFSRFQTSEDVEVVAQALSVLSEAPCL